MITSNMSLYQQYIFTRTYARWLPDKKRRETWEEAVTRYCNFFDEQTKYMLHNIIWDEIYPAIYNLDVMPSMRALATAGPALARENIAGYNCAYMAMDAVEAFSETLYILMCGTGVGFSCERQYIAQLPTVPDEFVSGVDEGIVFVEDSKEGWAEAYRTLIDCLYVGVIPNFDFSYVRPAGAPLKTFGGRASGPEPLKELFKFTIDTFKQAHGRKLRSVEVHDIMCKIAEVVVVGGVRRSALISLSNLSDQRMRDAKAGNWWEQNPQRALANNSVAYTETPDVGQWMDEWTSIYNSHSGERGIFNREAANKQAAKSGRRQPDKDYGCNPCSEIILRSCQFCNLTEVVVRPNDSLSSLKHKVRLATIMGTMQATLTKFGFLRDKWTHNTEEERLLGVSLTGIMDNYLTVKGNLEVLLSAMREHAVIINGGAARILGISPAAAITCVKPSGTVSQLVDCASGLHPRHSEYYLRTVRMDKKDPLYRFMMDKGFYIEDAIGKEETTAVVYFPQEAPKVAMLRKDLTAVQHLDIWLAYQRHWCEHKPSVTISVTENEWPGVGAWVWEHFDEVSGVSFLPYDGGTYKQAPYQELSEAEYNQWLEEHPMPEGVDWTELAQYEQEDNTIAVQTLACSSGHCEI